jgi:PAS domain S-box-containing protein
LSTATAALDFLAMFNATPSPYLVLATDLSIVAVNQAYLRATKTQEKEILGRHIFDVFPDNPDDPQADGVSKLHASLQRVLQNKCADTMAIQKYDIPVLQMQGVCFEERYWSPVNSPVFDADGAVSHIIHCVEYVTEFVRARANTASMEATIGHQALEIEISNRRLREAQDALEARADEKLRASEQRFRMLADSIPQMVWVVDQSGRSIYFNKQWTAYTGVEVDSSTPERIASDFVHPDDRARTMAAWTQSMSRGTSFKVEHRIRSASGEYRWFLVRAELWRDPDPAAGALWFGTSTDVHHQKLTEAALKNNAARYRSLFESIDEGFCIIEILHDADGKPCDYVFRELNPSFQQQTGLVDAAGKRMRELAPDHEAHWFEIYGRVAATGESIRFENEAKALNRWFDVFASRIEEEDGPKVAVVFKDITEQKRMMKSLHHSEQAALEAASQAEAERNKLNALLQAAPVGIVVSDASGAVQLSNAAHDQVWGASPAGLQALDWISARILDGEESPRDLITFDSPATPAVQRTVLITGAPVHDGQGRIVGAVVAEMDISDRIRAEEALRQADRRKDEFLAMLAHELRNPLAPIAAAADLLALSPANEASVRQSSGVIARQVRHMTGIVDDLLDVSRVTRGLITLDKQRVDAKRVLADAVEQVRPLIESRRHRLTVQTPAGPVCILGDVKRLVQVVANLLNNAAKYTPPGGELVLSMDADGEQVQVTVADNGIGISPELQASAFDLFTQAERSPDRSQGGLGIGLALVRSLVGLHDGHIAVHSEGIGTGSRFVVELPQYSNKDDTAPARGYPAPKAAAEQALKVMVVDDNVDAAEMLGMLVETAGHQVVVEHHPHQALERALLEPPDVMLLDIGLPDMDGYELARRLRSHPPTARALLIAVSGYSQDQDRDEALRAGFDHHLAKPVDYDKLFSLLRRPTP